MHPQETPCSDIAARASVSRLDQPSNVHRVNADVLRELVLAHQIIRNALSVMNIKQQIRLAELNELSLCDGEGVTRANERAAVIASATGGAA